MQVQVLLGGARVATVFTDVQLVPALLVGILLLHPMNLLQVGLQGAALGEGFVADVAFVGANACRVRGRHSTSWSQPSQSLPPMKPLKSHPAPPNGKKPTPRFENGQRN